MAAAGKQMAYLFPFLLSVKSLAMLRWKEIRALLCSNAVLLCCLHTNNLCPYFHRDRLSTSVPNFAAQSFLVLLQVTADMWHLFEGEFRSLWTAAVKQGKGGELALDALFGPKASAGVETLQVGVHQDTLVSGTHL